MYTTDWINYKHIPALIALEAETAHPKSERWLKLALKKNRDIVGLVCFFDGKIVAYMLYRLHKTSFEVVRLIVTETHRRRRVASMMLSKLLKKLTPYRRGRLTCVLRESNLAGHLLMRSLSIKANRVHRSFYQDKDENGNVINQEDGYEFEFVHPQSRWGEENGLEIITGRSQ